mmetsp:Transcript_47335/g.151965  ORF Transcript_47335/g.151965 Transcript_47335/m.151965 type:complete len:259 (-) Transcript_47335:252-1028(-)
MALKTDVVLPALNIGNNTNKKGTAKSWNSKMPNADRPCIVPRSFDSSNSCSAKAEEDKLKAVPKINACTSLNPSRTLANKKITADVKMNCAKPKPKTSRLMFLSRSKLNSRPISHKKKMMPASAKVSDQWMSEMSANPEGPMTMPMAKKPSTLEATPSFCISGKPMAVLLSNTSKSRPLLATLTPVGSTPVCAMVMSQSKPVRKLCGMPLSNAGGAAASLEKNTAHQASDTSTPNKANPVRTGFGASFGATTPIQRSA